MATATATDQRDTVIDGRIESACRALWRTELFSSLLVWAIAAIGSMIAFAIFDHWIYSPGPVVRSLMLLVAAGASIAWFAFRVIPILRGNINPEYAAQQIEQKLPDLKHTLLSYLTLRADRKLPGLRGVVVRSIASHAARRLSDPNQEPVKFTTRLRPLVIALLTLIVGLVLYALVSPKDTVQSVQRLIMPTSSIAPPTLVTIQDLEPGDTEVVEGTSLQVSATIHGLKADQIANVEFFEAAVDQEAQPRESRGPAKRFAMQASEEQSDLFAAVLGSQHGLKQSGWYRVVAGDASSKRYKIEIQEVPVVTIETVDYKPVAYTRREPFTSERGAISGLEGTEVTLNIRTNRAVSAAKIEFNPQELPSGDGAAKKWRATGAKALKIGNDRKTMTFSWILRQPNDERGVQEIESYRIVVEDEKGNQNLDPVIYKVNVTADLPPEVSIITPEISPKEIALGMEQLIEINALDPDFGLSRLELEVRKGDEVVGVRPIYDRPETLIGQQVSITPFRPEDWKLIAGDKVSVQCRAYDNRDIPGNEQADPNIALSDTVVFRIVKPIEEEDEPEDDGDGLRKRQPDEPSEQASQENSEGGGGQSGGAGGEAQSKQESGEGGTSGSGSSSDEPSEQEANPDAEGGTGEGETSPDSKASDSTNPESGGSESQEPSGEPSNKPSEAGSTGESPSSGEPSQQPPSPNGGDNPPGDQQNGTGSQSENSDPNGATPDTPHDNSEGSPAGDASNQEGKAGEKPSAENSAGSENGNNAEGDSPDQNADDNSDLHEGEIMDRIRDHMKKNQEAGDSDSGENPKSEDPSDPSQTPQGKPNDDSEGGTGEDPKSNDSEGQSGSENSKANEPEGSGESRRPDGAGEEHKPDQKGSGDSSDESGSPQKGSQSDEGTTDEGSDSSKGRQPPDSTANQNAGDQNANDQGSSSGSDPSTSKDNTTAGDESAETSPQGNPNSDNSGDTDSGSDETGGDESGASDSQNQSSESNEGSRGKGQQESNPSEGDPKSKQPQESGRSQDKNEPPKGGNPSDNSTESQSDPASQTDPRGKPNGGENQSPQGNPQNANQDSNNSPQSNGSDSGEGQGQGESPSESEQANEEFARKATDLVLDYMKKNQDKPDADLLNDLNWTKDDYQKFLQRWQQARELGRTGNAEQKQDFADKLKSLGLRPGDSAGARKGNLKSDGTEGLRERGSRIKPPPLYRDAFDAFKRSLSK